MGIATTCKPENNLDALIKGSSVSITKVIKKMEEAGIPVPKAISTRSLQRGIYWTDFLDITQEFYENDVFWQGLPEGDQKLREELHKVLLDYNQATV